MKNRLNPIQFTILLFLVLFMGLTCPPSYAALAEGTVPAISSEDCVQGEIASTMVDAGPNPSPTATAAQELQVPTTQAASTPTASPTPAASPTPTAAQSYARPLLVLDGYYPAANLKPGQTFHLALRFANVGQMKAINVVASIAPGEIMPQGNGGVLAVGSIAPEASTTVQQSVLITGSDTGKPSLSGEVRVNYYDAQGRAYSEAFTLNLLVAARETRSAAPAPTATPDSPSHLLIESYTTSPVTLEAGARFDLALQIENVGGSPANEVLLIMGGGSVPNGEANPAQGLSAAQADLHHFMPYGSSNVEYIGEIAAGQQVEIEQSLVVNSSTEPAAYPLAITFVYRDELGQLHSDEQLISLLVYATPKVDISFFHPVGETIVGQPIDLPLQIYNMHNAGVMLGKVDVSSSQGSLGNSMTMAGYLDPGGYFTLEPTFKAEQAGEIAIYVAVEYVDTFGETRSLEQELNLLAREPDRIEQSSPESTPGVPESAETPPSRETFWQTIARFFKGLFGFGSQASHSQ